MERNEVIEDLVETVKHRIGNKDIRSGRNTKNNSVDMTVIQIPEARGCYACIYIDDTVDLIISGKSTIDKEADKIARAFVSRKPLSFEDNISDALSSLLNNKEQLLPTIRPCVINRNANEDQMKEKGVPYETLLDLMITYRIFIEEGTASILLTNQIMESADITIEEVKQTAFQNNRQFFRMENLYDMFERMTGTSTSEDSPLLDMRVITNDQMNYGAAVLADEEYLEKISKSYGGNDYLIIPSSVHEIITLALREVDNPSDVQDIVKMVNSTELRPDEILSDSVYKYNSCEHRLEMIA